MSGRLSAAGLPPGPGGPAPRRRGQLGRPPRRSCRPRPRLPARRQPLLLLPQRRRAGPGAGPAARGGAIGRAGPPPHPARRPASRRAAAGVSAAAAAAAAQRLPRPEQNIIVQCCPARPARSRTAPARPPATEGGGQGGCMACFARRRVPRRASGPTDLRPAQTGRPATSPAAPAPEHRGAPPAPASPGRGIRTGILSRARARRRRGADARTPSAAAHWPPTLVPRACSVARFSRAHRKKDKRQ